MHEIAAEIISPAPPWLSKQLFDWSFDIKSARSIEEIWPERQKMREELRETWGLADLLDKRLQNSATAGFITIHSDAGSPDVISDLGQDLRELRSRIARALKSPILADENGKLRRGRGKPLLPNSAPPKRLCAAIIAEIIDFFHADSDAMPSQRKAWSAADKLWGAWFESDGWGDDRLTGWKDHFKRIDDPSLKSARCEIRRVLSILAKHQAELEEK